MRLGAYPCVVKPDSRAHQCYGQLEISERHRHRFEVNNTYRGDFEKAGIVFSGLSPDGELVEMLELPTHPFFVAVQFHPELKSRPHRPHPLFREFVAAAVAHLELDREAARERRQAAPRKPKPDTGSTGPVRSEDTAAG
jgi:CTP synthase